QLNACRPRWSANRCGFASAIDSDGSLKSIVPDLCQPVYIGGALSGGALPARGFRLHSAHGFRKRLHPICEIEGLDRRITLVTEKLPEVNLPVLPSVMTIGGHANNPGRVGAGKRI